MAAEGRSSVSADHEPEVELRHLRYFLSVAEELHFGRAATRLFISQPALSQSVIKLERGLGVQLLERSPHGVQLTDAGLELVNHARRLLADTENALERVRSVGRGQAGVLRTGVALLAEHVIAPALAALHAQYPGIVLDRTAAVSERLLAQLSDGHLQMAFVHQVPVLTALAQVQWELVKRGRLAVMMSRQHPLADRDGLALHQLGGETFLVNPRALAPSAYQGLKLMCAEFGGFDPKVTESAVTSTPTLDPDWYLIRQSAAIAIMAEEFARVICPPDVAVVPVRPPPLSAIAVAWRHGDHSVLVDRTLGFVRGYRDANGWLADSPRLSPAQKHLLDGLRARPVFLFCRSRRAETCVMSRLRLSMVPGPTVPSGTRWPLGRAPGRRSGSACPWRRQCSRARGEPGRLRGGVGQGSGHTGRPTHCSDVTRRVVRVIAKKLVDQAVHELFDQRDATAVERYWSPGYVEHSIVGTDGLQGLRDLAGSLPEGFRHVRTRVLGEQDLVVTHGRYEGLGPAPIVAMDLWRVADGKIVEHWDAHQAWVAETVSGHTMLDGPTAITSPASTAASKQVVESFVELIMMGGDRSQIGRFFTGDRFIQHNPQIADGVSGLGQAIQTGVWEAVVDKVLRIVAEGEFVFTQGDGVLHGEPTAFYDLFRVADDKLAEHWDVVFTKPAQLAHDNGLF